MSGRAHSRFAPSSLHRTLACPRSIALGEAAIAADPTRAFSSLYAAEGTVAHDIAEAYLREKLPAGGIPSGATVEVDGFAITIDEDMNLHGKAYADYVRDLMHADSKLLVEATVKLDAVVGKEAAFYGHLDAATWSVTQGRLDVVDFKYGRGVRVSPDDNPQLMAYALGAYHKMTKAERYAINKVGLHVYQPRIPDGIVSAEMHVFDLLLWGDEKLAPAIAMIMNGSDLPPLNTGDHCRFCPALTICPAWAEKVDREVREAFSTPIAQLAGTDLAAALARVRALAPFIEAVEDEAKQRLVDNGLDVPGFKPVVSQWRRFWSNGASPQEIADNVGLRLLDVLTEPVLRTPADLEKKIRKSDRSKLDPFVARKPYGVSIVPVDDPRPDSRGIENVKP